MKRVPAILARTILVPVQSRALTLVQNQALVPVQNQALTTAQVQVVQAREKHIRIMELL